MLLSLCSWVLKANNKQQGHNIYRDHGLILYATFQSHNQFQYVTVCKCIAVLHKSLPFSTNLIKVLWEKILAIQSSLARSLKLNAFGRKVLANHPSVNLNQ